MTHQYVEIRILAGIQNTTKEKRGESSWWVEGTTQITGDLDYIHKLPNPDKI